MPPWAWNIILWTTYEKCSSTSNMSWKSKRFCVCILPETTSLWTRDADLIYSLFKLRMCSFDIDSILWPGDKYSTNLRNWFPKRTGPSFDYYETLFEFLDNVLQKLDTDELTWYSNSKMEREDQAEALLSQISRNIADYFRNMKARVEEAVSTEITRIEARIFPLLSKLRTILELSYDDIYEKAYEELFCSILQMVGFVTYSGEVFSKLTFRYQSGAEMKSVSSQPDLLVYNTAGHSKSFAVSVVQVNKDNEMGKALKTPRNAEPENYAREGCFKKMAEAGIASGICDCSLMEADYKNGKPRLLNSEEEKDILAFLPRLLGEVAAVLNWPKLKLEAVPQRNTEKGHKGLKSYMAFGIVGFKVYVINFMCASRGEGLENCQDWEFHLIPLIEGIGIDVLISQPLNILKRNDRNRLFRLLFAMKMLVVQSF